MRIRSRRTLATWLGAVMLLALAAYASAGCGSPPDRSGDWHWVDDVALNIRVVARGPRATGAYRTVERRSNYRSTSMRDVQLSFTGRSTTTYSASLKSLAGFTDKKTTETVRVTVDIPPMHEARLRVRTVSQYVRYKFDAACIWFNAETNRYRTAIADYGVRAGAMNEWDEVSVSYRTAY